MKPAALILLSFSYSGAYFVYRLFSRLSLDISQYLISLFVLLHLSYLVYLLTKQPAKNPISDSSKFSFLNHKLNGLSISIFLTSIGYFMVYAGYIPILFNIIQSHLYVVIPNIFIIYYFFSKQYLEYKLDLLFQFLVLSMPLMFLASRISIPIFNLYLIYFYPGVQVGLIVYQYRLLSIRNIKTDLSFNMWLFILLNLGFYLYMMELMTRILTFWNDDNPNAPTIAVYTILFSVGVMSAVFFIQKPLEVDRLKRRVGYLVYIDLYLIFEIMVGAEITGEFIEELFSKLLGQYVILADLIYFSSFITYIVGTIMALIHYDLVDFPIERDREFLYPTNDHHDYLMEVAHPQLFINTTDSETS